uniref:N-methyltransferase FrzE n=1 Tax=Cladobotryum sp. TaxID=2040732 RepID=FRZE_CLASX|nr:FrzE [Cladobotryum sp.]
MAVVERDSDYYDSSYLADYYESLWTDHAALEDIAVYWAFFKERVLLSQSRVDSKFFLLDVGTGTGRVLHSLIDKAVNDADMSLDAMQFVGMDKSPFMLEQAQRAKQLPQEVRASWFVGTATALEDIASLADPHGKANLLIFAFSGINHLHQPGEIDQFFLSARRVLLPGGLALVSVCAPLLDIEGGDSVPNPYGQVKEVKSKRLEGILYREWETGQKIEGHLFTNSLKTDVVQVSQDGSERVIERNIHNIPLTLLTRDGLRRSAAAAKLEIIEERCIRDEVIFALRAVG